MHDPNPFAMSPARREAALKRLEREYDKDNTYQRRFFQTVADLNMLLKHRDIDKAHAIELYTTAKAEYDEYRRELRIERNIDKYQAKFAPIAIGLFLLLVVFFMMLIIHAFS